MFQTDKPENTNFPDKYATRADFCEALERDMKSLYLLSFLLTANHAEAEQCFTCTVNATLESPPVFRGWVRPWIKRSLIKNAIETVSPLSNRSEKPDLWAAGLPEAPGHEEIDAVTKLPPLERFVFVMSVLERLAKWDCALLLSCSVERVVQARMIALRGLPKPAAFAPGREVGLQSGFQVSA
jgi:DNA-directed RNA polymerase specialized sigma24 family protein